MRFGWGLAFAVMLATSINANAGDYAPLDCAKAETPSEKTICKTYALGQDEAHMATLYSVATSLVPMGAILAPGPTERQADVPGIGRTSGPQYGPGGHRRGDGEV